MANEVILRLDTAQESRTLTPQEMMLHKELKARVLGWAAIERSRRRQSSRLLQIKEGDACTKFFHQKANSRRSRNLIAYLKQDSGNIVWNHTEKENILYQHFAQILGSTVQRTCTLDWDRLHLSQVHDPSLDLPFTENEIKNTIREMPGEKAPGPDGFTGTFYKVCWHIIQDDLMAAIECFYHLRAGPLEHLNGAYIALIPKSDVDEHAADFRPISLINSFAKLITKTYGYQDTLISSFPVRKVHLSKAAASRITLCT